MNGLDEVEVGTSYLSSSYASDLCVGKAEEASVQDDSEGMGPGTPDPQKYPLAIESDCQE